MKTSPLLSQPLAARIQKIEEWVGQFCHDMGTRIQVIYMCVASIKKALPTLIDIYEKVEQQGLDLPKIGASVLKDLKKAIPIIENQSESMSVLLRSMSNRLKSGDEQSPDTKVYKISEIAAQAVQGITYTLDKQEQQKLYLNAAPDFEIAANDVLIEQVLVNLLNNAIYAIRQAKRGEIWITTRQTAKINQLLIKDTGTGIPESIVSSIFNYGFTTKPSSEGSGIGLHACRAVMRSVGGYLACETKEGKYTIFTLTFPHADKQSNGNY